MLSPKHGGASDPRPGYVTNWGRRHLPPSLAEQQRRTRQMQWWGRVVGDSIKNAIRKAG